MFRNIPPFHLLGLLLCFVILPGCKKEIVPKAFYPRSAHEAYAQSAAAKIETVNEFTPGSDPRKPPTLVKRVVKRVNRDPDPSYLSEIRMNLVAIAKLTGLEMPREWRVGLSKGAFSFMDMLAVADQTAQDEVDGLPDDI